MNKKCTRCKKTKRATSYYIRRQPCKACTADVNRQWREANPEKHRAVYRRSNHKVNLRIRYGLTVDEFDVLASQSDGNCAICLQPDPRGRRLSLDHCHTTGRIRGFLCSRCNLVLGAVGDDPDKLRRAADYLVTGALSRGVKFLPGFGGKP